MFKLVRCPTKLESFFTSLKEHFRWNQGEYFKLLVLLVALSWRRCNVSALYRHLDEREHPHRTRFNNFLQVGRFDPAAALRQKAYELLAALNPQPGETVELIFDDTKKEKRGRKMEAVGKIFDPVTKTYCQGQQYVQATIRFRGHCIPFGIRLYVKEEQSSALSMPFKKTTQMVAEMIEEFEPPAGVKVRVLFDSFYLCPVVVKACRRKGFRFVSVIKDNRNLFKGGRKLKAGNYGRNLFKRIKGKRVRIAKKNGTVHYSYVDAGWLTVSDLGSLHVVFSRKNGERHGVGLVTDDPELK